MEVSLLRRAGQFLVYTLCIYACYISSGVYHQKILKHSYPNPTDNSLATFDASIVFTFFPQLVCTLLGALILALQRRYAAQPPVHVPADKALACSLVINVSMMTYNKAVQAASFPAVVMVKSCSLLSVVLVALFCSRVKDKSLKLGRNKLWIGVIVSVGIFMFNYFKVEETGNDRPISLASTALLVVSLLGDGLLPDLQAEIKSTCHPGEIDMYYHINKYTCILAFLYALLTWQLPYIATFIAEHPELQYDLLLFSCLNAVGQLIIYRMIKLFKQHIAPFVIATRKCVTVIVNIVHFGHSVNDKQLVGMVMVFAAIMLEVYENYKEKKKQEQIPQKTMEGQQKNETPNILGQNIVSPEEQPLTGEPQPTVQPPQTTTKN